MPFSPSGRPRHGDGQAQERASDAAASVSGRRRNSGAESPLTGVPDRASAAEPENRVPLRHARIREHDRPGPAAPGHLPAVVEAPVGGCVVQQPVRKQPVGRFERLGNVDGCGHGGRRAAVLGPGQDNRRAAYAQARASRARASRQQEVLAMLRRPAGRPHLPHCVRPLWSACAHDGLDVTTLYTGSAARFEAAVAARSEAIGGPPRPNWTAVGVNRLAGFDFETKAVARIPRPA